MSLIHESIARAAAARPDAPALRTKERTLSYGELAGNVDAVRDGVIALGLEKSERVAVYLPKRVETVASLFGAAAAGCAFVPVNPLLKPDQVAHILRDCNVRLLITESARFAQLAAALAHCADLRTVVLVDGAPAASPDGPPAVISWAEFTAAGPHAGHRAIESDMASIFYTSGSTGKPKGVVFSHRNMCVGADSVAEYLGNGPEDHLLAVLPLSFDYGFSQLSTAFSVGASATLLDYLLPKDVIRTLERDEITGLAGVPPLWLQLVKLDWPAGASGNLRYVTNSGGAMPLATLETLRRKIGGAEVFLMYGLTEAFRSTYLPPAEVDARPGSIGKAIPNAEVSVRRPDGTECGAGEPGELVHRGPLVSLGYWNDPARTAERFRPVPTVDGLPLPELAVWSGDQVRKDSDGFLYFIGRSDDMIKSSGYRISPTEVEEVAYGTGLVTEVAAVGVPHAALGQAVVLAVVPAAAAAGAPEEALLAACRERLPGFMVPQAVRSYESLPRGPNGKIDRKSIAAELEGAFESQ